MPQHIKDYSSHGVTFGIAEAGAGRDILYLSSGMWFADDRAFVERLSGHGRVLAPVLPGFGRGDPGRGLTDVDDLAYLILDLVETLQLKDALLVGASFGGWIAAEMAIKSCNSIAAIAFIDPLGIKVGGREVRDIADLFGLPDADLRARAYVDPSIFVSDVKAIDDVELERRMRARESLARYGWSPFMHNPKLPGRLHRISAPSLFVWGARDRIVAPSYGRHFAERTPGSRFVEIPGAAHFPHIEQPAATLDALLSFADAHRAARR